MQEEGPPSHRYARLPVPAPLDALWSYRGRPATDLNVVKAARAAIIWRHTNDPGTLAQASRYLGWLVRFPWELVRRLRLSGPDTRRRLGRGYAGQIADMLRMAVVNGLMPRDYYAGELARHHGDAAMLNYIPYHLYDTVATHLTRAKSASFARVRDKLAFETCCCAAGLPAVRTVAVVREDGASLPSGEAFAGPLPPGDLISKPIDGGQGKGVLAWRHVEGGTYASDLSQPVSPADLMAALGQQARSVKAVLVQERLVNSPSLAKIAGSALCTTRVVTLMNERGKPEIVEAFYRTSVAGGATIDNFHGGGILFPIDLATGTLRPGCGAVFDALKPVTIHPQTGQPVAGQAMPGWEAISDLAIRLHTSFSDLLIAGWDIAYTPDGPVVIEVNVPPGITPQRQGLTGPMVGKRFFSLIAHHAAHWLETAEPEGSRWRSRAGRRAGA